MLHNTLIKFAMKLVLDTNVSADPILMWSLIMQNVDTCP